MLKLVAGIWVIDCNINIYINDNSTNVSIKHADIKATLSVTSSNHMIMAAFDLPNTVVQAAISL